MIYVCSDIHGFWDKYKNFMEEVNFSDDDILYIVGDVLDRGSEGIRILQDIMRRKNVILLKGNHELMMLPLFDELVYSNQWEQLEIIRDEVALAPQIGQEYTLKRFAQLTRKQQLSIIRYLKALPLYKQITVNSQKYLLVHAGLPDFDDFLDMKYYSENELLFGPHDFFINHFNDTIILVGHKPTRFIDGAEPDKIFKSFDSWDVDCGLGFGGNLGVLCLETGEELYF